MLTMNSASEIHTLRGDKLCLLCTSLQAVENEQHFLFNSPLRATCADLLVHVADLYSSRLVV